MSHFLPQFSLSADPSHWSVDKPEADDDLHRPDPRRDVLNDSGTMFTVRGLANLGCLSLLLLGLVTLLSVSFLLFHASRFLTCAVYSAGYPVISHFTRPKLSFNDGFNYGGTNASGIVCLSVTILQRTSNCDSRSLNFPAAEVPSIQTLQIGQRQRPPFTTGQNYSWSSLTNSKKTVGPSTPATIHIGKPSTSTTGKRVTSSGMIPPPSPPRTEYRGSLWNRKKLTT